MTNRYPWSTNTSQNTADQDDPRYETPGGAQHRVDTHVSVTGNIADRAVTQPKIAIGAVGANQIDPALLPHYGDIATNAKFEVIDEQLADVATLTSSSYGIAGNGTDETSKIAAMMAAIPANGANVVFDKSKEITVNGTSLININNKHNVVIEGLKIKGTSAAVFQITNGSSNITFRDCYFSDVGQAIYLFACSEVTVDNCVFDNTGYGVIQRIGFVSNNVKVVNCTAKNMKKDFIEANCTASARSKNWTISNNHYLGGVNYPVQSIEERFVGITGVENVIISHNIVEKVCGDSAIHLEDVGGNIVIDHNIIDNVVGGSYIWIIHNEKTALIDGNTFLRSDSTLPLGIVLANSNVLTNNIKFNNNIVRGLNQNIDALRLQSHSNFTVVGNTFENCEKAIRLSDSYNILINSNEFVNNNYDINANGGSTQIKSEDIQIIGNRFRGTLIQCIIVRRNTAGTSSSARWLLEGNVFSNDALGYDTVDFTCIGNVMANGKTFDFNGVQYVGSTGYVAANNRMIGTQAIINSGERVFTGTAAPTAGSYLKNDKVINTNQTRVRNIEKWACITPGTPGTWIAYGCGWGTTGERPTLTANDSGYVYFDSTIAKMILWNGTAWLV